MGFAVFNIQPGKLYVRDFDLCVHGHELMNTLAINLNKIAHQDDLFALLGSAISHITSAETNNIVASIFLSQNADVINNEHELASDMAQIGIDIKFNSQGFWSPSDTTDDRLMFIQNTVRANTRQKAG